MQICLYFRFDKKDSPLISPKGVNGAETQFLFLITAVDEKGKRAIWTRKIFRFFWRDLHQQLFWRWWRERWWWKQTQRSTTSTILLVEEGYRKIARSVKLSTVPSLQATRKCGWAHNTIILTTKFEQTRHCIPLLSPWAPVLEVQRIWNFTGEVVVQNIYQHTKWPFAFKWNNTQSFR